MNRSANSTLQTDSCVKTGKRVVDIARVSKLNLICIRNLTILNMQVIGQTQRLLLFIGQYSFGDRDLDTQNWKTIVVQGGGHIDLCLRMVQKLLDLKSL